MRILVIGGSGLLGSRVVLHASSKSFRIMATYNNNEPPSMLTKLAVFQMLNVIEKTNVARLITRIEPDVIIDTHALHKVDYCEEHKDESWQVNVVGTRNVVETAKLVDAHMIYISTDYVFDGNKKSPYSEEDEPNPLNWYAKCKLEAEKIVLAADGTVLRTAIIYSWSPRSRFLNWILENLRARQSIKTFTDQWDNPTLAENLAEAILAVAQNAARGTYHATGSTCHSRYEMAVLTAKTFDLDESLITPIIGEDLPQKAKRPHKPCLNVEKIKKDLAVRMISFEEGLKYIKKKSMEEPTPSI
ncbi:MAG: dTDP-4-dehydrorhamnose reductase [Promethearchaeota archaeon]